MRTAPRPAATLSILCVLLMFAAVTAAGRAFQTPAKGGAATFHLRAIGEDGSPVMDLKPADVALKINGKARDVKSLQLVQLGAPAGGADAAKAFVQPPFATNAASEPSRVILIVVDDESIPVGREVPARAAVNQILDGVSPRDRVGLVTVPRGNVSIQPGLDRAAIKNAITALVGRGGGSDSLDTQTCRTQLTLQALRAIVARMAADEPGTVVFMASGLVAPSATTSAGAEASATCTLNTGEYQQTATAVNAGPANFYTVFLADAMPSSNNATLQSGLENLGGITGAGLVRFTGAGTGAMARVIRETAAYYVGSFDPEAADRSGSALRLEAKVTRDKVKTRVMTEMTLPKGDGAAGKGPAATAMIRDVKVFRDLPLRATAFATRAAEDKIGVRVFYESADGASPLNSAVVGIFDDKGKLMAQCTAQAASLTRSPSITDCVVPPGTYRLRVAATDGSGRSGAVDDTFVAALVPAGSLKLGSLSLWAVGAAGLQARLQFTDEADAVALFEMYGKPEGNLSARVELAATADGPALATAQVGASPSPEPDRFALSAKIPLGALAPGDYVVRAIVGAEGQPEAKVMHTLRKVAK